HLDAAWAATQPFGQRLVNSMMTLSTVVGLSVGQVTQGTIVANLGFREVELPRPLFHGDTLYAETEVVEQRLSASRPGPGAGGGAARGGGRAARPPRAQPGRRARRARRAHRAVLDARGARGRGGRIRAPRTRARRRPLRSRRVRARRRPLRSRRDRARRRWGGRGGDGLRRGTRRGARARAGARRRGERVVTDGVAHLADAPAPGGGFDLGPALLFCPADRPDRFAKAADRADAVVLDLEDAVAPHAKDAARRAVVEASATLDPER